MNEKDILNNIIANDGSCDWADATLVCPHCPLSKLKVRDDGSFTSCIEAINAVLLSKKEADAKYKEVAEQLLLDKTIDELLLE